MEERQSLIEESPLIRPQETSTTWNPVKNRRFGLHAGKNSRLTCHRVLGFCFVAGGLSGIVVLFIYFSGGLDSQPNKFNPPQVVNSSNIIAEMMATSPQRQLHESGRSGVLDAVSALLGWTYFTAWSLSFYPQVWYNHQRKSVVGLSFDYQLLNILGYAAYSIFASTLLWNPQVRSEYREAFGDKSLVTVQDAAFAIHGAVLTMITIIQCFVFERGNQRVSSLTKAVVSGTVVFTVVYALVISVGGNNRGPQVSSGVTLFSWLCWVYWLSVVKLGVTVSKYVPQALMNFAKRSTVGWSIGNVLLDFTGGVLSIAQLLLDGATLGWSGVIGDPIKFCLGFVSMVFDVLFMVQHYVLYPDHDEPHFHAALLDSPHGDGNKEDNDGGTKKQSPSNSSEEKRNEHSKGARDHVQSGKVVLDQEDGIVQPLHDSNDDDGYGSHAQQIIDNETKSANFEPLLNV